MKIEYFKEYSSILNKDMEYKVYGHAGKPCIAFPCQNGRFYDYENNRLIESISWYIEQGKIQVFCVDSLDIESWSDQNKDSRWRIEIQEAYFHYIIKEVVHRIYEINTFANNGRVATGILAFGCSMGAYHALNFFMRKPDIFDAVLALSGIYHSGYFFKNYADDLTFLNSPLDSIRCMEMNHFYLDLYRKAKIIVCVGQGMWEEECLADTKALDFELNRHHVPAWFDYWGYDCSHDWPSWLKQTPYFLYHILEE